MRARGEQEIRQRAKRDDEEEREGMIVVRMGKRGILGALVVTGFSLVGMTTALPASAASAWWHLSSGSRPASLQPESEGEIVVMASNLGDADVNASNTPVQITDTLPEGLEAVSVEAEAGPPGGENRGPVHCSPKPLITCTFEGTLPPYDLIEVRILVQVKGASAGESNVLSISGGETPSASITRAIAVSGETTPFGVEDYELIPEEEGGTPDTQAGSHPFQLTTTLTLNQTAQAQPAGSAKDVNVKWPPGLIGNPTPLQQCTLATFLTLNDAFENKCPPQAAVGVAMISIAKTGIADMETLTSPVFNLEPSVGEPARFGFLAPFTPVLIDPSVRSGEDYGITVHSYNIAQIAGFLRAEVTIWGVPGDPRHDFQRGWDCLKAARAAGTCSPLQESKPLAFLSLPTSCTGPLQTSVQADSWQEPAGIVSPAPDPTVPMPAMDGCNQLPFNPSIKVTPDGTAASSATGLKVDVHVPQQETLNPNGLAESDPRNITVTLPQDVAVNPAGGDGLQACSEGLVGFDGFEELNKQLESGARTATFLGKMPTPLEPGVNFCPSASKIGTVRIKTPLLPNPIEGAVYLATQNQNPFGSLVALYLVAEDPVSGVLIELAGDVHLTENGQLITTFENSPQAPFEDAELEFFGGERAPLSSPSHCGPYTTTASFAPWSGNEPINASSTFAITSGPNGGPCPGQSLPFSPSLTGGTTNINAGAFSPLTTTIGREDGNQDLGAVQLQMPAGLEGLLSSVKLCDEADANAGTCGPESQIGETTVSAGIGIDPVSVTGGKVYITEKYDGAPFGLSIVNPVKAGPFDLEHDTSNPNQQPPCDCVVVRAKVEVDPHTAALTVTTDPSGPHSIPHMIDGIPVQIRKVNVTVNRSGFTFNPTSCAKMEITGSIASDEGASSPMSVPFQATNCAALGFAPKFSVSTSAKTSKAKGASLSVKLTYPKGPFGSQSNIRQVKVDLPKQLPSRLTTLQKACAAAQFRTNPARCPAASIIGHAKAITPLIPVPLEGPVYFVSNGDEAFPNLIMVLQGYGVTVDLVGDTFISKAGITSSTFKTVPDAPVGSFELLLPEGRFSALAANGNLCKNKLAMPTLFIAQNGARINRSTRISVTGCPKHKAKHVRKAGKKGKHHRK
jgi:hypothetical protein